MLPHYLVKHGNTKVTIFIYCCITGLLDFFIVDDLQLMLALLYDSIMSSAELTAQESSTASVIYDDDRL